ncbi:LysR family transcriptional regulator [Entomomonas asaccharolytica]|uniref:LysR family transcriptional regulator n=1 Tax=Entomomonas asaccharolytica TaxID=2785331 RepID=A0A974NFM3_9GAMM|nr:LysR family transcriptional regulator [Entomomonas asaccharolytica]QQP85756.1 LysR family transcriptional regulator [Entomomonas asaccharolytica]
MLNRLDALKYFCIAAETLQFRETAVRMSVSPQVVTRMIAELEEELGTLLFVRNTRNMQLTEFGERFLPQAQQYLLDGEKLFATAKKKQSDISGVVRITAIRLPENEAIITDLVEKCADYPELRIDWRVDSAKLHWVENQIDIGLRIGFEPDPLMIIRKISTMQDKFVVSPKLLAKLGQPKDLDDLQKRYPVSNLININTGRSWGWPINDELHLFPKQLQFATDDQYSELSAALAGMTCSLVADYICNKYLATGKLVELFPDIPRKQWQMYLYRPQRTITSAHVLKVFDWLTEILHKYYKK